MAKFIVDEVEELAIKTVLEDIAEQIKSPESNATKKAIVVAGNSLVVIDNTPSLR